MLYRILKFLIGKGIDFYYKEIRVKNEERLEKKGAKIIVTNHPNTLMDAWLIGKISKEPVYYMAKATFFNSKFKLWLFQRLGLVPVNRSHESGVEGVSNTDSFEFCYRILEEGKTLLIFPEGNSYNERQLRPLKTGTARIALETVRRNKGELDLEIIPVGYHYSRIERFRSFVLVNVGESIRVNSVWNEKGDSFETAKELTETIRERLEGLLVGSKYVEYEGLIDDIVYIVSSKEVRLKKRSLEINVELVKEVYKNVTEIIENDPEDLVEIEILVNQINRGLKRYFIASDFIDRRFNSTMFIRQLAQSFIFMLAVLPFFMIGLIHNLVPYLVTKSLVPKLTKDIEYFAPLSILIGLIVFPIFYFLTVFALSYLIEFPFWVGVIYFMIIPLFGVFSFFLYKYVMRIGMKTNFVYLMMTKRSYIMSLRDKKNRLRELVLKHQ